jgi:2-polyprenyl-3-methyl-5-hydroxy-6-metoxy-1,4-benzoquinol methylase
MVTLSRRRGVEILDDPFVDPEVMRRSMKDVERANSLFGGKRAALAEVQLVLPARGSAASLLDVGTGRGDIRHAAAGAARFAGVNLHAIGLDISEPLLTDSVSGNESIVRGDALALPFRDSSIDIVLASQVLHHFPFTEACAMVRELDRVARRAVVISDLRRSVFAAAGLWLGSFPLGFHPVSRHDGVVSVLRGFVPAELSDIVARVTGKRPEIRRRLGFRLTTHWYKNEADDRAIA